MKITFSLCNVLLTNVFRSKAKGSRKPPATFSNHQLVPTMYCIGQFGSVIVHLRFKYVSIYLRKREMRKLMKLYESEAFESSFIYHEPGKCKIQCTDLTSTSLMHSSSNRVYCSYVNVYVKETSCEMNPYKLQVILSFLSLFLLLRSNMTFICINKYYMIYIISLFLNLM